MSRPLDYDDLYRFRLPSDPQLSPDGSRVAFVVTTADRESDENRSSIFTVDVDGSGPPVRLTQGPADAAPRWSPDGTRIAFVAGGRGDATELRVLPLAGGESVVVTSGPGVGAAAWSPDGTRLAYLAVTGADGDAHAPVVTRKLGFKADGAGVIGERRRHLFVVDAAGGEPVKLTEGDFSVSGGPAWSPDGSRIAWAAATDPDSDLTFVTSVYVSDAGGGAPKRVTEPPASVGSVTWTPDGTSLLVAGDEAVQVGHTRLYTVPADGGPLTGVAPAFDRNVMVGGPGYPGAPPRVSDDGTRITFCARDAGCTHVYEVPLAGGDPVKLLGAADLNVSGVAVDDTHQRLVAVVATPRSPGEIYIDGEPRTQLFDADIELVEPVAREFTAPDGTAIGGWVLRRHDAPAGGPLLLDIHGGPHNAWNGTFDAVHLYHQVLANDGWTILYINPRGSDGYGEAFYRAVSRAWGVSDADDFLSAVDALVADGLVDPARIAVTGYSYGGYMTCWLSARTDRFAAAIPGGCVSDLTSESGAADMGSYLGRYEADDPEQSPLSHVDGVRAPTLILHGGSDERCPVGQAEEWFTALRLRGVEVEFVRYPGGSHLFILSGRPSHRIDYCRRVAEWAVAHTAGGEG